MKTYKQKVFEIGSNNQNKVILKEEELDLLKKIMLQVYCDIKNVCDKYKLSCMAGGGSCLGAIRHHGYIPWDDDFDIIMPRKDYEFLKTIFDKELGTKYTLNGPNYYGKPTNRFPKVLVNGTKFVELGMDRQDSRNCIKVDIFIIENIPDNKLRRNLKGGISTLLMYIGAHVLSYEGWKRRKAKRITPREFCGLLFSFLSSEKWFSAFDKQVRYKDERSKYVGIPSGRKHYWGEILPRDTFSSSKEVPFEDKVVSVPANYDLYLKNLYNDYMTLPPEEKREKHFIDFIDFGIMQKGTVEETL